MYQVRLSQSFSYILHKNLWFVNRKNTFFEKKLKIPRFDRRGISLYSPINRFHQPPFLGVSGDVDSVFTSGCVLGDTGAELSLEI